MEQSEPLVSQSNEEMIHLTPGELNNEVKELANDVLGLVDVTESLCDQLEFLADIMDKGRISNNLWQFSICKFLSVINLIINMNISE